MPRRLLTAWAGWLHRRAPLLYLCTALPLAVCLVFAVAPFQVPDEDHHFFRIVQLLEGHIVGMRKEDGSAGGEIPGAVVAAVMSFEHLKNDPGRKLDPAIFASARQIAWARDPYQYAVFYNTVIYPPVFYLPSLTGVWASRTAGLSVLASMYAGRLVAALVSTLLAAAAIALAVRGRLLLFALLALPMSLSLFASLSQDALALVSTALAVAATSRLAAVARPAREWELAAVAVLVGLVVAARPPTFPLLGLLAIAGRGRPLAGGVSFGLAAAIAGAWIAFGAAPVKVPFRADEGVSISGQIAFLLEQPLAFFSVLASSFERWWRAYLYQFIGELGWLDLIFPEAFYWFAVAVLTLAVFGELLGGRAGRPRTLTEIVVLFGLALLSVAAIYGTLYLAWTPVGRDFVEGVQGRYLLQPAMLLCLALPALAHSDLMRLASWCSVQVFGIANLWIVPAAVMQRYYG